MTVTRWSRLGPISAGGAAIIATVALMLSPWLATRGLDPAITQAIAGFVLVCVVPAVAGISVQIAGDARYARFAIASVAIPICLVVTVWLASSTKIFQCSVVGPTDVLIPSFAVGVVAAGAFSAAAAMGATIMSGGPNSISRIVGASLASAAIGLVGGLLTIAAWIVLFPVLSCRPTI